MIRSAIEKGALEQLDQISDAIHSTGALDYTLACAAQHAEQARACLADFTDSPEHRALVELTEFALQRKC